MQGIYDRLTRGVYLPSIYVYIYISSVVVCKVSMIDWTGGSSPFSLSLSLYIYIYNYIYSVAVCKASVLDWPGGSISLLYIYKQCSGMQGIYDRLTRGVHLLSIYKYIYMQCNGMQGPCAWLTRGVHQPSIYMHCTRSSSECTSMQGICAELTRGCPSVCYIYALE